MGMTSREIVVRDLPKLRERLQKLKHIDLLQMSDIYGDDWERVADKSGIRQAFASVLSDDPNSELWTKIEHVDGQLVSVGFVWRQQS
jgi:hypothetical protein